MGFLKKLLKAIVKIIIVIAIIVLIVVAIAATIMTGGFTAVVFGYALWQFAVVALLVIALCYVLDSDTASAQMAKIGKSIGNAASDIADVAGEVVSGAGSVLSSVIKSALTSPLGLALLVGGGYYLLKEDDPQILAVENK